MSCRERGYLLMGAMIEASPMASPVPYRCVSAGDMTLLPSTGEHEVLCQMTCWPCEMPGSRGLAFTSRLC